MPTVYGFRKYDIISDEIVVSKLKATKERIEEIGAELIEGSGKDVEDFQVDSEGVYNPDA